MRFIICNNIFRKIHKISFIRDFWRIGVIKRRKDTNRINEMIFESRINTGALDRFNLGNIIWMLQKSFFVNAG